MFSYSIKIYSLCFITSSILNYCLYISIKYMHSVLPSIMRLREITESSICSIIIILYKETFRILLEYHTPRFRIYLTVKFLIF